MVTSDYCIMGVRYGVYQRDSHRVYGNNRDCVYGNPLMVHRVMPRPDPDPSFALPLHFNIPSQNASSVMR